MDNTDVKRRVILVNKSYNNLTGERIVRTKPKPIKKRKIIVAAGTNSMSWDKEGHTIGDILTAKALPFRFAMVTLLQRRGFRTDKMSFKYILIKFYNQFVAKKFINESVFINNVVFKIKPDDNTSGDIADVRNQTAYSEITEITNAVVDAFANARLKYQVNFDNGLQPEELLDDEDITMAKAAFVVERELLKKSKQDHYVSSGELKKYFYWISFFFFLYWLLK